MELCNWEPTPLAGGARYSNAQSPMEEAEKKRMESIPYRAIMGCLMYLACCTRPDIAYAVSVLCRFLNNPGMTHWSAAKRILRYLKGTATIGCTYTGPAYAGAPRSSPVEDLTFYCCTDSSHGQEAIYRCVYLLLLWWTSRLGIQAEWSSHSLSHRS